MNMDAPKKSGALNKINLLRFFPIFCLDISKYFLNERNEPN